MQQPCISLGNGVGRYTMVRGNFHIEEHLHEKVALQEFTIKEEHTQKVVITLQNAPGNVPPSSKSAWHLVVTFEEREGRLEIQFEAADSKINRFWMTLCASETEKIYGCGEQFSVLNLRGKMVPLWVQEAGVGRGKDAEPILAASDIEPEDCGDWYTTYRDGS